MSRKKINFVLENVVVESVAAEGKCIAHTPEGQVIFIDYAVPGDVVDLQIFKKKKSFLEGKIIKIETPSQYRKESFCEHFGICGGCKWQLLPYSMQLEAKQKQVTDQLTRIGHLNIPTCLPIIGSDKTEYYRNKLEFSASNKRWILEEEDESMIPDSDRNGLGFHVGKFFDKVLDIKHCYLQKEPSNSIRLFIKQYAAMHGVSFFNPRENTGLLRNIFIRTTDEGAVMLIVCFSAKFSGMEDMLDAVSKEFPSIVSLYYVINSKLNDSIADLPCRLFKGEDAIYERMEDLQFRIGPKSFYQTNNSQALKLYRTVRKFAMLSGKELVYDLYTGTGTIAQFVSRNARKVIGIEYVKEAIDDAKLNAEANGTDNCEFYAGDMKDILNKDFIETHGRPDVIIVDPPRAGMHPDVVKTILFASPKTIIYVSCNPASQARDMALLSDNYNITAVQPVDMFPHTQHVENVCKLMLKV